MNSSTINKIRKSYEKYRATIQEWIKSGKYERWQFADNEYTDFETYIVAYNNERNILRAQAAAAKGKKEYLKKENITRRLLKQTVQFKKSTISKFAKEIGRETKEVRELLKQAKSSVYGKELWDKLFVSTGGSYEESSYWYETLVPPTYTRTKRTRGDVQLTKEEVYKTIFGDLKNEERE